MKAVTGLGPIHMGAGRNVGRLPPSSGCRGRRSRGTRGFWPDSGARMGPKTLVFPALAPLGAAEKYSRAHTRSYKHRACYHAHWKKQSRLLRPSTFHLSRNLRTPRLPDFFNPQKSRFAHDVMKNFNLLAEIQNPQLQI